jgi:hypothetical protein
VKQERSEVKARPVDALGKEREGIKSRRDNVDKHEMSDIYTIVVWTGCQCEPSGIKYFFQT